jgi:hypothetical protein
MSDYTTQSIADLRAQDAEQTASTARQVARTFGPEVCWQYIGERLHTIASALLDEGVSPDETMAEVFAYRADLADEMKRLEKMKGDPTARPRGVVH